MSLLMNDEYYKQFEGVREYLFSVVFPSAYVITPTNLGDILNHLLDLSNDSLEHLINVQFLISKEVEKVLDNMEFFLNNIEKNTERVIHESAVIRGNIDWGQTLKLQIASIGTPIYSSKIPHRQFDTPYNQLVKYVLVNTKKIINKTRIYINTEENLNKENNNLKTKLSISEIKIEKFLNSSIFRNISTINYVPSDFVEHTKQMNNPMYKFITNLFLLYRRLYVQKDLSTLVEKLFEKILLIQDEDKLFELINLFTIAKQLDKFLIKSGGKRNLEILGNRSDTFATYYIKKTKVNLRYQRITDDLKQISEYTYYLDRLGIANIRNRLPDILLTFEYEDITRHIFIEIKNTSNKNYILESIYKMYGYLNDFKLGLPLDEVQGILIVRDGIERSITDFKEKLWTISFNDIDRTFEKILLNYIK